MSLHKKIIDCFTRSPVVVVLGSTATGKSKLAIELAKSFNGEIISADSMQIYKGLDIITNKVTNEEQRQVRHHMIDVVDSPSTNFNVVDFRTKSLDAIHNIVQRSKLPIIVGGTNYYIEALLWNFLIEEEANEKVKTKPEVSAEENLYGRLQAIDPDRAAMLHPNDSRKIARSLQVFEKSGVQHSVLMKQQKSKAGSSQFSGPLRFGRCLVFWLNCEQTELRRRITDRVDKMVSNGLLGEVTDFYERYKDANNENGLFQAIGFKEFVRYLRYTGDDQVEREKRLEASLEILKSVTIKYSKKQRLWVKNRFLARHADASPDVYELNVTDIERWDEDVLEKAVRICQSFLRETEIEDPAMPRTLNDRQPHQRNLCKVCGDRVLIGDDVWKKHLTSRMHRRRLKRKQKTTDGMISNLNTITMGT